MIWTALCGGVVLYALVARLAGGMRRSSDDLATAALWVMGASGIFAIGIAAAVGGQLIPTFGAAGAGLALSVDPKQGWTRVTAHLRRAQGSTVTPFQNAT